MPHATNPTKTNLRMTPESETTGRLSPEARVQHILFAAEVLEGQKVVHELPLAVRQKAILIDSGPGSASAVSLGAISSSDCSPTSRAQLQILTIPSTGLEDPQVLAAARLWVELDELGHERRCLPLILQGAQIFWAPGRTAVIAPSDRLEAVRGAIIEFCYFEAELRSIEDEIGQNWPQLELDTPLAFEFRVQAVATRKQLMQRFQQVISMRVRLARMAPHIECPPIYPPTLASQIGERLREKTRLADRLQFTREQTEVFEKIYEMCGQRASDFMSNRTSHSLEWVIILLLATETILLAVDFLSSART